VICNTGIIVFGGVYCMCTHTHTHTHTHTL